MTYSKPALASLMIPYVCCQNSFIRMAIKIERQEQELKNYIKPKNSTELFDLRSMKDLRNTENTDELDKKRKVRTKVVSRRDIDPSSAFLTYTIS